MEFIVNEVGTVYISYKKLWKLLIDMDWLKKDLREATGLSQATIAKLAKNRTVSTDVLARICCALHCSLPDIAEYVPVDETV